MIAIKNGKIITPEQVIEGKMLLLDRDRIFGFADNIKGAHEVTKIIDAQGRYIMPGLIDLHSDQVVGYIRPRPLSQMDFEFAFKVLERDLLGAGITTMYHSLSLYKYDLFGNGLLKSMDNIQKVADLIASMHERSHLIRHRLHLRIEIDNLEAFDIVREMINQGKAHLISFMDHTPGQGQYRDVEVYRNTITSYKGDEISSLGFDGVMEYHKNKTVLSPEQRKELAGLAHDKGISVASHDDDSDEKLILNKELGVNISEFPISMKTARTAKEYGFQIVVGAANILRGNSHNGNLSAVEAILEGCADIICSDYYPAAVLSSIFHMHEKHGVPLPQMANKASLNPAKALRTDKDYGSLEEGKKADLLIVDLLDGYPVITHAFVDGNTTSRIEYRV